MTDRQRLAFEIVARETGIPVEEVERRLTADWETLDYQGAAKFLGISVPALRQRVRSGSIPHIRLGPRTVRFKRSELEGAKV